MLALGSESGISVGVAVGVGVAGRDPESELATVDEECGRVASRQPLSNLHPRVIRRVSHHRHWAVLHLLEPIGTCQRRRHVHIGDCDRYLQCPRFIAVEGFYHY